VSYRKTRERNNFPLSLLVHALPRMSGRLISVFYFLCEWRSGFTLNVRGALPHTPVGKIFEKIFPTPFKNFYFFVFSGLSG
jgi:hypothetical protein